VSYWLCCSRFLSCRFDLEARYASFSSPRSSSAALPRWRLLSLRFRSAVGNRLGGPQRKSAPIGLLSRPAAAHLALGRPTQNLPDPLFVSFDKLWVAYAFSWWRHVLRCFDLASCPCCYCGGSEALRDVARGRVPTVYSMLFRSACFSLARILSASDALCLRKSERAAGADFWRASRRERLQRSLPFRSRHQPSRLTWRSSAIASTL